jgi:drug/metabolite transporter (DMT)-like permease
MKSNLRATPYIQALLAAVFFGASAPLSKLLLGEIDPITLAGLLYIGSGISAGLFILIRKFSGQSRTEARLRRKDLPWLIGAVVAGGIAAPIILLFGLRASPAATASLLLNFEGVATTLIAVLIFREAIGRRVWWAVGLITVAAILLTWNRTGGWGFSLGALGIVAACMLWGMDNNFTRNVSAKDPLMIVTIKGLAAGGFSLLLATILGRSFPGILSILFALLLGSISYGVSIVLFIYAMRALGAARTSALFGLAPFIGMVLSFILKLEIFSLLFLLSLPLMAFGAWLLLSEDHAHLHLHPALVHEHRHTHIDEHHQHVHDVEPVDPSRAHSHLHVHDSLEHAHAHFPDIHHRHEHNTAP